jgi:ribosomal protein S18 acetylase RimI-like enzyme
MSEFQPIERSAVTVHDLSMDDVILLEPILRQHVRDLLTADVVESEVAAIQDYMRGSADSEGRVRHFIVARTLGNKTIGCVAVSEPASEMKNHFKTNANESVELLNVFVDSNHLGGKGVGRALFDAACTYARRVGAKYLLVNSGPRYQHNWGFYDRVCDRSHGFIHHMYGEGRHAKTWKKALR